jgi:hypothetical protein
MLLDAKRQGELAELAFLHRAATLGSLKLGRQAGADRHLVRFVVIAAAQYSVLGTQYCLIYNRRIMFEAILVPEKTAVTAKGDGGAVDISAAAERVFLIHLQITRVIEQESLDLGIWGSADGAAWGDKPLASFPQKFYAGEHPLLLDLGANPEVRFLRAHWDVSRWGRGTETPMFEFQVSAKEVPAALLAETRRAK